MFPPLPPRPESVLDAEAILEPLVPLFAPYCGGVTQQLLLEAAVRQLLMGEWSGERRLETLRCELHFPDLPSVNYEFTLPSYRLVVWLMQRHEHQLPVSFWRWLLLGELPRSSADSAVAGGDAAVA